MNKIYTTTDFGEVSKDATRYASELAIQTNAKLALIHAYQPMPYRTNVYLPTRIEETEKLKQKVEKSMANWCNENIVFNGLKFETINKEGPVKETIVNLVNEEQPDLLIMGTHNAGLIDKVVFGSITGRVLPEITCPLLVVPEGVQYTPFSKIVFATDFHDSDVNCLHQLVELATPTNAEIKVLHILHGNNENQHYETSYFEDFKEDVSQRVKYSNINFELIHANNLITTLNEYTKHSHANLLAMAQTGKNWFARLFDASITKRQLYRITIPTLFFLVRDEFY
jgi:nucleotide-binding universal stress UspA family protein